MRKILLLFCTLSLNIFKGHSNTQFDGDWLFIEAKVKEYSIGSKQLLSRQITTSVPEDTKGFSKFLPIEIHIGNPLLYNNNDDIFIGNPEFTGKTITKSFKYGFIADNLVITIFNHDKGYYDNDTTYWKPIYYIVYEINDGILLLKNTFYADNEKGYTMLYEITLFYCRKK